MSIRGNRKLEKNSIFFRKGNMLNQICEVKMKNNLEIEKIFLYKCSCDFKEKFRNSKHCLVVFVEQQSQGPLDS